MTIGHQVIDSDERSVGRSVSVGVSEALDDSPGPKVIVLLAGGHRTELSGCEVGGLLVSYLC